jgi:hypothetical protein
MIFACSKLLYDWQSVSQSVCLGVEQCQSQSHFTADSQWVGMSWCRAHFLDVWPDIASFSRVWILKLLSNLSDERQGLSFVSHNLVIFCVCIYH